MPEQDAVLFVGPTAASSATSLRNAGFQVRVGDSPDDETVAVVEQPSVPAAVDAVGRIRADGEVPVVCSVPADVDPEGIDALLGAGATDCVRRLPDPAGDDRLLVERVRSALEREAVERERDRYRTLVETAGDGMYVLDADGRLEMVNDALAELTGYDREDLSGSPVTEFMDAESVRKGTETITELLSEDDRKWGRFVSEETTADGERRFAETNVAVLTDGDGQFDGSVGVMRDVTERKRQERQLASQNERLEEFAEVVGHDLRNPLGVIQGHADALRGIVEADDAGYHLAEIATATDQMGDLLSELLSLAREGKVVDDTEVVALDRVTLDAWRNLDVGEGTLASVPDAGTVVEADRSRLQELFENLFRNGLEHAGPAPDLRVGTTDRGFFVADDGPGIPRADRETVFERRYTTAEGGTGLGLAIVARIVDAHGWSVSVTESADGGARFEFATTVEADGD